MPERNLLVIVATGILNLREILGAIDEIVADPGNDRRNVFQDLSGLEAIDLNEKDMGNLSSISAGTNARRTVAIRCAMYAPSERAFAIASAFKQRTPADPNYDRQIFRSLAPALRFVIQ